MSIELIFNTVWRDCARVLPTDSSNVATADTTDIENITRGPRHFDWAQSGTAVRRLVYESQSANLSANRAVITRADRLASGYTLRKYAAYPGTATTIENSGSPPTCIGQNSQDYVASFTAAASQEAFSLEFLGSSSKKVNKFYLGTAIEFTRPQSCTIVPFWDMYRVGRKHYLCSQILSIRFAHVSQSIVDTLEDMHLQKDEPCFFHDPEGGHLTDKLWHGVLSQPVVTPIFNNSYDVDLQMFRLREYPSVA